MKNCSTCIILAGGLGTRLRSAVADRPKCLAPVHGRPFLELQLDFLALNGVNHFVLSLGYMAETVVEAIRTFRTRHVIDVIIESKPLGTGGAVLNTLDMINHDEALVTNGDTWINANISFMLENLKIKDGELMRLASINTPNRSRYGGLILSSGKVVGFEPKGLLGPGLINGGLYRLHRKAFDGHNRGDFFSLESDLMPQLISRSALTASFLEGVFIDIGIPEDYRRFCDLHG